MLAMFLTLAGLGPFVPQPFLEPDLAQLQEVLADRQDPRGQSQAALLLIQSTDPEAQAIVRHGLKQVDNEETFVALATAIRIRPDNRFTSELISSLGAAKPRVRQSAAETLAALPVRDLVPRLRGVLLNPKTDVRVRQMTLWALGRCGRKEAAEVLISALQTENEELVRVAVAALHDLTGQNLGADLARWNAWWSKHKNLPKEQWLTMRLSYQSTRAQRLEGELVRARAQALRLHQQLYTRLPVAERFTHLQSLLDQDDPAVRALAVGWCVELLAAADAERLQELTKILIRLTHDLTPAVQRDAVVALGRLSDDTAFERLRELLEDDSATIRAASVRALALQARQRSTDPKRLKQVIPLLQVTLDDHTLEVVVEAAEALGMLGAPEAGPVLISLLRHPTEKVRQTAAQALERTADASQIDGLLQGLDDPAVTVRFGLLGALAKASGNGQGLSAEKRKKVNARLESLLKSDADASVRSRAATVIGECGTADALPMLWEQMQSATEGRVQEKAWDAFVEVLTRSGSLSLIDGWEKKLLEAKQDTRRVQLWAKVYARWDQVATTREQATVALERLAKANLDIGKWSTAAPLYQTLLTRGGGKGGEALRMRCLTALSEAIALALKEGNRPEALRLIRECRGYLAKDDKLTVTFDTLEKQAASRP